jgi:hypothetical protein
MTFFMIALTNSLHKLVNATIKYTGEPTRSRVNLPSIWVWTIEIKHTVDMMGTSISKHTLPTRKKRKILRVQGQNLTITFSEVAHFTITFSEVLIVQDYTGVEGLRLESVRRWMVVCCGVWPDCSGKYGK